MRGQIAAACQECYRVHKDAKHIWVNMEVDVRIIDRMAWWDESYIFKATRLSRVSKKPTDQKQILKKTDQQQWINKKKINKSELQLKPVHSTTTGRHKSNTAKRFVLQRSDYCMWQKPIHSLLALVSLHPSQGVRTSPPLYRGTCTWKILLMDKALHQFDMANELKYIYIQITSNYDVWFHPKTGLFCRCCRVSSHPTCHPDPTADEPVPSILTPSWHSFRGFGWERSITLPPTQQVVLMVPFDLMQRSKGARRTIKEMQLLCKEVSYTSWWQNGERTCKRKCKLLPADGAWWSMLLLVTDVYLNASQDWEWVLNVKHLVPSWSGCKGDSTEIQEIHMGSYEDWWLKQR